MNPAMEYNGLHTRVVMGAGSVASVADEVRRLGGSRVMLFTGARTSQTNLAKRVVAALGPMLVESCSNIVQHSAVDTVHDAAKRAAAARVDLLLAVGGGSSSDSAKAVAILLAEGFPLHNHANRFTAPDKLVQQQLNQPKLPILVVPSTASAAEVTPGAGVRDEHGHKLLLWDDKTAARTIILDPEANVEFPAELLASSGMNALAHCIEGLYSKKRNPVAEGLALQGLRLLGQGLPAMVRAPQDVEARAQVLYGAHVSGMVIASTRTCIHHGICHCLGAPGGLAHGVANSIMLPHAMRFIAPVAADKLKLAAQALGENVAGLSDAAAADKAVEAIVKIQHAIKVPTRLRDTSLKREMLPVIAEHTKNDRALYFSPGPFASPPQVLKVLEAAW